MSSVTDTGPSTTAASTTILAISALTSQAVLTLMLLVPVVWGLIVGVADARRQRLGRQRLLAAAAAAAKVQPISLTDAAAPPPQKRMASVLQYLRDTDMEEDIALDDR